MTPLLAISKLTTWTVLQDKNPGFFNKDSSRKKKGKL